MGAFCLGIAGHSFAVQSLFDSTADYCARYPATGDTEVMLTIHPDQLAAEQARLHAEALAEGLKPRTFSQPFLERSVLQRLVAGYLRQFQILLLHGSTVSLDGRAYLFTAKCGTGKSTHTRLWRQAFGDRAVMINDDKPFLAIGPSGVTAWGAPWSGKHGLDTNLSAPLAGICVLERGTRDRIIPILPEEGLPFLLTQAEEADAPLVARISQMVPLWHMACTKTPAAPLTAWEAMASR